MEGLDEKLNQYKIPVVLSLVGLVLIIGGLFSSGLLSNIKPLTAKKDFSKESVVKAVPVSQIKVDISGAVKNPGVYSLKADARMEEAIKVADGFSASASAEYISKGVNLAQRLSDGQKIYIPFEGETLDFAQGSLRTIGGQVAEISTRKVNVNSASVSELDSLPGVGAVTSQKIIDNRPYGFAEDLLNKKAVNKSTFERIKDLIQI